MFSLCLMLLALGVAFENVNAQDYTEFYKRLDSLRRPIFIPSSSGGRRFYINTKRDVSSLESSIRVTRNEKKVRLDVYYETDCPDSMRFITEQLYPLYKELGEIVDIHLIPYGKAYKYYDDEKNKYSISCHHGPSECYGNTVQACVLSLYPNQEDSLSLINCMEKYPRPSKSGQKCARRLGLDWEKINKCATGELGSKLLMDMADKTESLDPNLHFVPWIVFDSVFNNSDFRIGLGNLKSVVCRKYKGEHESCPPKTDA